MGALECKSYKIPEPETDFPEDEEPWNASRIKYLNPRRTFQRTRNPTTFHFFASR